MKEHHQAYIALCLTLGEFTAAAKMLFDGHLLTMYLALTYLARETSGGKHYHDIVVRWVEKTQRDKQCAKACAALAPPTDVRLTNPFGGK